MESRKFKTLDTGFRRCDEQISVSLAIHIHHDAATDLAFQQLGTDCDRFFQRYLARYFIKFGDIEVARQAFPGLLAHR